MNFPRYWAKDSYTGTLPNGKTGTFAAFGWSSTSLEDAKRVGRERAKRLVENGFPASRKTDYDYEGTSFREEVVDSLTVGDAEIAVISRNRYGALVLNTDKVMFADIDFPSVVSTGFWDSLVLLFSPSKKAERMKIVKDISMEEIRKWFEQNSSRSFRLYRTYAGFRLLFTDTTYDPTAEDSKRILRELMADHLYCTLTERKKCFRARLGPKPWRCNSDRPPSSFPWASAEEENEYRVWEEKYSEISEKYSTCEFVEEFGIPSGNPVIQRVVDYHDKAAIQNGKPLA